MATTRSRTDGDIRATNLTAADRRFVEANKGELSPSTLRAKWTHSPDDHEDRPGQTLATRDPDVIRAWADARNAQPATVGREDQPPRTLRMDFPPGDSGRLRQVSWDAWLKTFRDRKLVFLYQEHKRDGRDSNFFRLDSPQRQDG